MRSWHTVSCGHRPVFNFVLKGRYPFSLFNVAFPCGFLFLPLKDSIKSLRGIQPSRYKAIINLYESFPAPFAEFCNLLKIANNLDICSLKSLFKCDNSIKVAGLLRFCNTSPQIRSHHSNYLLPVRCRSQVRLINGFLEFLEGSCRGCEKREKSG